MSKAKAVTVEFIKLIAKGLGELNEQAVYVGGATVPFYLPPEMQAAARPTEDVDVVLEVIHATGREKLEENLRKKGFKHDQTDGAPICRWKYRDLTVDIMSPNEKVLGFTNKWFAGGIKHAHKINLDGIEIKILTLPYFLATKFEAFKDRGNGDYMGSPDMEDIVTLLDGVEDGVLEKSFENLEPEISRYLRKEFETLLENKSFRSALPGAIFDRTTANERASEIIERISALSDGL